MSGASAGYYTTQSIFPFFTVRLSTELLSAQTSMSLQQQGTYLPEGTSLPEKLEPYIASGNEAVLDISQPLYMLSHHREPVAALFPIRNDKNCLLLWQVYPKLLLLR